MVPSSGNCGVVSPPHSGELGTPAAPWVDGFHGLVADEHRLAGRIVSGHHSAYIHSVSQSPQRSVKRLRDLQREISQRFHTRRRNGGNVGGMDQKPPTAVIEAAHRDHLSNLPFADTADFDDADRGFIGALEPCVVKAADGRVVWDNDVYSFLAGDAPTHGASQPVAAEPAVRQAGPLRGGRGHLPGPRSRPVQHQLHRGRHRDHRHRSADLHRDGGGRAGAVSRASRRPAGRRRHLHPQPRRPFRRRARRDDAGRRRRGQGRDHRAGALHRARRAGERLRRHRDGAAGRLHVRRGAGARAAGPGGLRAGPGRRHGRGGADRRRRSTSAKPARSTPSTASRSSSRWRRAPRRPRRCTSTSRSSARCAWPRTPPTTCTTC